MYSTRVPRDILSCNGSLFALLYKAQKKFVLLPYRKWKWKLGFVALCSFAAIFILKRETESEWHPQRSVARANELFVPPGGSDVLEFARNFGKIRNMPVYIFYRANSGQLNNQIMSLINALVIAKVSSATLVTPFAYYGIESLKDLRLRRKSAKHSKRSCHNKNCKGYFMKQHGNANLVGDYFDEGLLNRIQPTVNIGKFLASEGGRNLKRYSAVLVRKGDAPYYFHTLSGGAGSAKVRVTGLVEPEENDFVPVASRKQLDCNFNISAHFKGLPYRTGANGNYLFLSKLYRSHTLNCTNEYPHWLEVRKYLQPRREFRELVLKNMSKWGRVVALHLRLFPFDDRKYSASSFTNMLLERYGEYISNADYLYVAYSSSSEASSDIFNQLTSLLGERKVLSAKSFGDVGELGSLFQRGYSIPVLDMWVCVQSYYFIGRLGSSLSWNVHYWRHALHSSLQNMASNPNEFYKLVDFSTVGAMNPTDTLLF